MHIWVFLIESFWSIRLVNKSCRWYCLSCVALIFTVLMSEDARCESFFIVRWRQKLRLAQRGQIQVILSTFIGRRRKVTMSLLCNIYISFKGILWDCFTDLFLIVWPNLLGIYRINRFSFLPWIFRVGRRSLQVFGGRFRRTDNSMITASIWLLFDNLRGFLWWVHTQASSVTCIIHKLHISRRFWSLRFTNKYLWIFIVDRTLKIKIV